MANGKRGKFTFIVETYDLTKIYGNGEEVRALLNGGQSDLLVNDVPLYGGDQLTETGGFLREMFIPDGGAYV